MFHKMALSISAAMKQNNQNLSKEKAEELTYGLEILLYEIFLFGAAFLSALPFGLFFNMLSAVIGYACIRGFASGAHARTRAICFISYFIMLYISVLVPVFLLKSYSFQLMMLLFCIDMILLLKYAPGDTIENPMTDEKKVKQKKVLSCLSLTAIFIVSFFLGDTIPLYANSPLLAASFGCVMTTPLMYQLLGCKRKLSTL